MSHHRRTVPLLILVLAAAGALIAGRTSDGDVHELRARFAAALDIAPGQEVRLAGSRVGKVTRVEVAGGGALVTMDVSDRVWPLPASTRAALRWGSTTAYLGRFVQLAVSDAGGGHLEERDVIPASATASPVEFDQVYTILDRRTRPRLRRVLAHLADTFEGRAHELGRGVERAPRALGAASTVLDELGRDRAALGTLVRSGAHATAAIAREDPALRDLVSGAAATFDEFAARSAPIEEALRRAPGTLARARSALARTSRSVPPLRALLTDLGPGVDQLARLAPALDAATRRLGRVAPTATTALEATSAHAAGITDLLASTPDFLRDSARAMTSAAPMLACVRPYGPEIAGFAATWAGYTANYDANGHYARALPPVQPVPNGTPQDAAETLAANPQLGYASPRPPGQNVGQPWFQPQCGAGEDALDVSKDPQVTDPQAPRG